jgi:hypothetical protein
MPRLISKARNFCPEVGGSGFSLLAASRLFGL